MEVQVENRIFETLRVMGASRLEQAGSISQRSEGTGGLVSSQQTLIRKVYGGDVVI